MEEENRIRKEAEEKLRERGHSALSRQLEEIQRVIHQMEIRAVEQELLTEEVHSSFQKQIEASRSRSAELYDSAPVGYFTLDQSGLIVEVNRTGAELFGMERGYLLKTPFSLFVANEDQSLFQNYRTKLFRTERHESCEVRLLKKDRSFFYAQLESIVVIESDGTKSCRTIVSEIGERKQAEEVLRETGSRYRTIFERAPIGIARINPEGRLIESNRALQLMLGYSEEELGRMVFTQMMYPEDVAKEWQLFQELIEGRRDHYQLEKRYYRREGSVIWGNQTVFLVRDAEGAPQFAIAMAQDITPQKRAEEEITAIDEALRERTRHLEEVSQARNRFFSYISHELKTPVNSIIGFTQLLRNRTYGSLNPEQLTALTRIHGCAEDLVRLISNILDLGRIESGKMHPKMIETNLAELLERITLTFEPLLREKGLTLEKRIHPSCPIRFLTDPALIRSVLTNLLSNAVKFTHQGMIRVELNPMTEDKGIQVMVSDTGIGIEPPRLERIFEEYQQSDTSVDEQTEYTKGSGLGLAIVKKMVDSLGGGISIQSTPGQGTTFMIKIPEPSA